MILGQRKNCLKPLKRGNCREYRLISTSMILFPSNIDMGSLRTFNQMAFNLHRLMVLKFNLYRAGLRHRHSGIIVFYNRDSMKII